MNKEILSEYIDACELVKETEQDIQRLRRKRGMIVQDGAKGSNPEFPYQEQHFHLEGTSYAYTDDIRLRMEEKLLEERKAKAEQIKIEVEKWMLTIPIRMQRIIRCKIFEGMTWGETATMIGRRATGDGIRMEFNNFMKAS